MSPHRTASRPSCDPQIPRKGDLTYPLHVLSEVHYTKAIYIHYVRPSASTVAEIQPHYTFVPGIIALSATDTMRRGVDSPDEEEGGFEMENNPKRRYTSQWGHWRGPDFEDTAIYQRKKWQQFFDTFKRDPNTVLTPHGVVGGNGRVFDAASAAYATAHAPLARRLKGRHLQMIAFGGSIGTCACWDLNMRSDYS